MRYNLDYCSRSLLCTRFKSSISTTILMHATETLCTTVKYQVSEVNLILRQIRFLSRDQCRIVDCFSATLTFLQYGTTNPAGSLYLFPLPKGESCTTNIPIHIILTREKYTFDVSTTFQNSPERGEEERGGGGKKFV